MSSTLTKTHIVEAVADANGFPKKKAYETIETLLEIIKRSLESGEDVLISGFGKFLCSRKEDTAGAKSGYG